MPTTKKQGPMARIFGVRHLSPGASWHLERFLEEVDPTAILIEGPADAGPLLPRLVSTEARPPLALLCFTQARPVRSLLYPLAAYSPEWVALSFGAARGRELRWIDLPAEVFLALPEADHDLAEPSSPDPNDPRPWMADPYAALAAQDGEPSYDAWWERRFEHLHAPDSYRAALWQLGVELRGIRHDSARFEREMHLREAHMRGCIREVIAEGHDPARVVVVCGAYHAPALVWEEPALRPAEKKRLARAPASVTLMPYSYARLSTGSGYGAGVEAPNYLQLAWEVRRAGGEGLAARFLSAVAREARGRGLACSSAEVIEAVRLAEALAAVRSGFALGLQDLRDAAITCFAGGDEARLADSLRAVEVGDAVGAIPAGVPRTPLQEEFYAQLKALKLDEYLKDREQPIRGHTGKDWLDRRPNRFVKSEDAARRDRDRSILLHRLDALGIGFAREVTSAEDRAESSYKERWLARWTPDCEIALAERSRDGNSIEEAAEAILSAALAAARDIGAAARLARRAVVCDLRGAAQAALARAQTLSLGEGSFAALAEAAYEFDLLARYGDVSRVDTGALRPLVATLFLRGALLLDAAACCDDEAARPLLQAVWSLHAVAERGGFDDAPLALDRWWAALLHAAEEGRANPLVAGAAAALCLGQGQLGADALDALLGRWLSPGEQPGRAASFFEGLSARNRAALLSLTALWRALDLYVAALPEDDFRRALVALRRAFSSYREDELRRIAPILESLWGPPPAPAAAPAPPDDELEALRGALDGLDWEV